MSSSGLLSGVDHDDDDDDDDDIFLHPSEEVNKTKIYLF